MRRYFFTNFYVAGIRVGIQAGHSAEEMWAKTVKRYLEKPTKKNRAALQYLVQFAEDHKTWILLNGGDHDALHNLITFLNKKENPYSFDFFKEPGLNNAITSVTLVLPERMYDETANAVGKALLKGDPLSQNWPALEIALNVSDRNYTPWEIEFLKRKAMCGLAS